MHLRALEAQDLSARSLLGYPCWNWNVVRTTQELTMMQVPYAIHCVVQKHPGLLRDGAFQAELPDAPRLHTKLPRALRYLWHTKDTSDGMSSNVWHNTVVWYVFQLSGVRHISLAAYVLQRRH